MGRLHRLDPEHGIHHVFSRGTRRWTLFIDELDYQRFMLRLSTVCSRYGLSVYAYCLMGNHFHLAVYCRDAQLSIAMRDLKSLYAREHNDRHGFSGPLFESRFGSKVVTTYEYLQTLIRYIHRNPLAINPTQPLENHRWSSHAHYLDSAMPRPEWFDIDFPRALFGNLSSYRDFVETNMESDELHHNRKPGVDLSDMRALPSRPAISAILLTIAASAGCDVVDIRPRMRNGLIGLVALIAANRAAYTSGELCDPCGFRSAQGVRNAIVAAHRRLEVDRDLRSIHDEAVAKLALE